MNYHNDLENAEIEVLKTMENRILGRFRFDGTQRFFRGHFPGAPILPGVFQLEMVRYCLEKALGRPMQVVKVGRTKFLSQILPEMMVGLEINFSEDESGMLNVKAVVRAGEAVAGRANLTLAKQKSE